MTAIKIRNMVVNLDHVASAKFKENDPSKDHDDRCSIVFAGKTGAPLEVYGSDARDTYERICEAMGVEAFPTS